MRLVQVVFSLCFSLPVLLLLILPGARDSSFSLCAGGKDYIKINLGFCCIAAMRGLQDWIGGGLIGSGNENEDFFRGWTFSGVCLFVKCG